MSDHLTISHLSVGGVHSELVKDVSFELKTGQTLALIGASGSGKSLTCLAALDSLPYGLKRTDGQVLFNHQRIHSRHIRGHLVSSIMQNPRSAFNPVQTMLHHGIETLKVAGRYTTHANAKNQIAEAMKDAELTNSVRILKLYPHEMSGGMLQRMMIALALLSSTPFIFADEPTTDLDLVMQSKILTLLKSLVADKKLGLLIVTHDMGVVASIAQKVAVMDKGQIVEQNPVDVIFTQPSHPKTAELVNAHLSLYNMELV